MHEGVVEGGVDVRDTKDQLALCDLGAERDGVFLDGRLGLLGRLEVDIRWSARASILLHIDFKRILRTARWIGS